MTRLDTDDAVAAESPADCDGPRALLLEAREVPLGGVRAMEVHRALPQRDLPLVGAWCFLDRFGPQRTRMRVEPHPHIGLQTVTWPLVGEVRHRDTLGSDVVVRRGALNLMTSGHGIAHSEYSLGEEEVPLDALQLWVALPESRRHGAPDFERHENLPLVVLPEVDAAGSGIPNPDAEAPGAEAIVVVGEFAGASSPATMHTPIVGAEIALPAGSRVRLPLRPEWEHALVGVTGEVSVHTGDPSIPDLAPDTPLDPSHLLYLGRGRSHVEVAATSDAALFLLGGEPFEDDIVMWWNFVGRSHEEIVAAREAWEADEPRFGHVIDHGPERIPAPPMPAVRLTRRRRRI
ncbi:pirin family protein [Microbacterium hominis]|uniref:Pirin family protein n=1 Tax=Microbacterium hominis TaxID=162426 RepID=A0A7D4PKI4_9MICO|nr:pirin family protein [Microbacterium hominis]QKJ18155.1 pirin family protein [Microbacterium hominis]